MADVQVQDALWTLTAPTRSDSEELLKQTLTSVFVVKIENPRYYYFFYTHN